MRSVRCGCWPFQCIPEVHLTFVKVGLVCPEFLTVFGVLFNNVDVVSPISIQVIIIDGLDFFGPSVSLSQYSSSLQCTTATLFVPNFSSFSSLFSADLIASWSTWIVTSGKSVPTLIEIPIGNAVIFHEIYDGC